MPGNIYDCRLSGRMQKVHTGVVLFTAGTTPSTHLHANGHTQYAALLNILERWYSVPLQNYRRTAQLLHWRLRFTKQLLFSLTTYRQRILRHMSQPVCVLQTNVKQGCKVHCDIFWISIASSLAVIPDLSWWCFQINLDQGCLNLNLGDCVILLRYTGECFGKAGGYGIQVRPADQQPQFDTESPLDITSIIGTKRTTC
jgi:hypothetical protein